MSLKFTEELCVMTMKNDTKIEEKLTSHFKIDMRNLTKFDPSVQKCKKLCFNGFLVTKIYMFELQNYRGVIFYDAEE